MRATGGDQAKCAAKMDAIRARATDGRSAAQQGSADGSPPSMEKCMRVTGGDQAKRAAKMAAIKARGMRGNGSRAKASPLCKINPRHLNKRALKTREKRCN